MAEVQEQPPMRGPPVWVSNKGGQDGTVIFLSLSPVDVVLLVTLMCVH